MSDLLPVDGSVGFGQMVIAVSFVVLAQITGAPAGSTYSPAHMENGRLVPGQTR